MGTKRAYTLFELLIVMALVGVVISIVAGNSNCGGDFGFGRPVSGKVHNTGSRMKLGQDHQQEKIAIALTDYKADKEVEGAAGGGGKLLIECVSTRCATLLPGDCASFSCKYEARTGFGCGLDQDIVACELNKLIDCPK
jgi:prepilin-type N-terminal cleavage/methylation domain-containing protein